MLTALTNRIGDVAILILISQLAATRVFNFRLISSSNRRALRIRFILVVVAAITKRAQLPFSSWLPAAIAAPTPVSALVHSSTLVTAGVYLLIRHNYIL
jgi:NADH-ubiquinone oxidoreductase chain 5